jgi:hypothetical protein
MLRKTNINLKKVREWASNLNGLAWFCVAFVLHGFNDLRPALAGIVLLEITH